jgi:hypothetical protein
MFDNNKSSEMSFGSFAVIWFLVGVPLSLGVLAASVYIVLTMLQSFNVI